MRNHKVWIYVRSANSNPQIAFDRIDNLQKQVDQLTASQQKAANPNLQLTDSDFRITEYSDTLVARIIERIEVISAVRIKIEFIGGYTVTVPLQS
jgi:hypothetical protein